MQDDIKKVNLQLMKTADAVYVTTVNEDGYPVTRAMFNLRNAEQFPNQAQVIGDTDFKVILSTNTSSVKVDQLKKNPRANAYFCHPQSFHGLMLSGDLVLVDDPNLRHALWEDGWERYYPAGMDDPDYAVLRLRPQYARGWYQGHHFQFETQA